MVRIVRHPRGFIAFAIVILTIVVTSLSLSIHPTHPSFRQAASLAAEADTMTPHASRISPSRSGTRLPMAAKVAPQPTVLAYAPRVMIVRARVLNVRGLPNTNAVPVARLKAADRVVVIGEAMGEDPYHDGRNVWFRLSGNRWVWGAGLTTMAATPLHYAPPAKPAPSVHLSMPILRSAVRPLVGGARDIAQSLLAERGWSSQWSCLDALANRESGWNVHATNPGSGAYGIPQSLPGSKMATAGADWRTNPATQLRWMMDYVASRYGTPCGAWAHSQATGWY